MGSSPAGSRPARWSGLGPVALVAVPTLALSLLARGGNTIPGDVAVARFIQRAPEAIAGPVASGGYVAGSWPFLLAALLAIDLALLLARRPHDAIALAISVALHLTNGPLKALFDSPRPTALEVRITRPSSGLGFPSGHASGAVQLYGALLLVLDPLLPPGRMRTGVRAILVAIPIIVGLSRVYVGAHWPSDVLGGWLWGLLTVLLVRSARLWRPDLLADPPAGTA